MSAPTTTTGPEPEIPGNPFPANLPGCLAADVAQFAEATHKASLATLENRLSELLELPVTASLAAARQTRLADSLDRWGNGWSLLALDLAPLRGQMILGFPPDLLSRILDIFFAVPLDPAAQPRQNVTEIELQVLREFFDVFVKTLAEVWDLASPLAFERIAGIDEEVRQLLLKGADDATMLLRSSLEIDGFRTTFEILMPAFLIRLVNLESKETAVRADVPETVRRNILNAISTAQLHLEAVLPGSSVKMGELMQLRAGQVLMLGTKPGAEFACRVNGKTQFKGTMVSGGSSYRFQVGALSDSPEGQQ